MSLIPHSTRPELMDLPDRVSKGEMAEALDGIERVNRWLGGYAVARRSVLPMIRAAARRGARPVRLCDIGCGSADIPRELVRAAREEGLPLQVTAVELHPELVARARRACAAFPEIQVLEADARAVLSAAARGRPGVRSSDHTNATPAHAEPFDVVTAALFLHHFQPHVVSDWLALMAGACRVGWAVNDLERGLLPWLGIKVLAPVITRNAVFRHDAPLSVRRAYTRAEWLGMARRARLERVAIRPAWAFRVAMTGPGRS